MSKQPAELLRCRLPCDSSAPQLARQALTSLPAIGGVRNDALLVGSELVTNAVLHSGCDPGEEIEVVADLIPEGVRIAVIDVGRSANRPARSRNPAPGGGGLGLRVVEAVARRWGTDNTGGRRVWAELAVNG